MFLKASAIAERVLLSKLLLIKTFQVYWANKLKLWRRKWILLLEVEIKVKKEVCEKQAGRRDQERLLCSLPGLAFSYSIAHSIELC